MTIFVLAQFREFAHPRKFQEFRLKLWPKKRGNEASQIGPKLELSTFLRRFLKILPPPVGSPPPI